ncbi:tetratricopeptide repeat protein [Mycolicibacterium sphagni]|uniref:Sel1 repeat family protein n=1 Tax=Mycolicibacterium sphagni TaxID=1786 RepID=A0A255DF14_9MYCO|nr:SEL1-like repeat protein [Mycolicibacterium sphagni]OYN77670.1 hypothetical protein CG716_17400 [Mycolicibacterium sphagni]
MHEKDDVVTALIELLTPGKPMLPKELSLAPELVEWVVWRLGIDQRLRVGDVVWFLLEEAVCPLDGRMQSPELDAARFLLALGDDLPQEPHDLVPGTNITFAAACALARTDLPAGAKPDFAFVRHRQAMATTRFPQWGHVTSWTRSKVEKQSQGGAPKKVAVALYDELDRLLRDEGLRANLVSFYRGNLAKAGLPVDASSDDHASEAHGAVAKTSIATDPAAASDIRELVELFGHDNFPAVAESNPYVLGATESHYGDRRSYGLHDRYVARTRNKFDETLVTSISANDFTLIVGPSKAGKTRSAFEAIRGVFGDHGIVVPVPGRLSELVAHPLVAETTTPLVIWLDDLDLYLGPSDPLTPALLDQLLARPGDTRLLGTLRSEQRAFLLGDEVAPEDDRRGSTAWLFDPRCVDDVPGIGHSGPGGGAPVIDHEWSRPTNGSIRHVRQILHRAATIDLDHTTIDADEQLAAASEYADEDFQFGLGATLACAPELLRLYRDAEHWQQPVLHAVLRAAIDWARCGRNDPIPEQVLARLAEKQLRTFRSDLAATPELLLQAIEQARTPRRSDGKAVALISHFLDDGTRGYKAFAYLVSADDEAGAVRLIGEDRWDDALQSADAPTAYGVMLAAYWRGLLSTAFHIGRSAAELGSTDAMHMSGYLYETGDPPDSQSALIWYRRGADLGDLSCRLHAARLLSLSEDASERDEARRYYALAAATGDISATYAYAHFLMLQPEASSQDEAIELFTVCADAGDADAMHHLGLLLTERDNADIEVAKHWLTEASRRNITDADIGLGHLLLRHQDPPRVAEAKRCFQRAVDGENTRGLVGLADIAENFSTNPDRKRADRLYKQAALTGDAYAMHSYGVRFMLQSSSSDDARYWLSRAADTGDIQAKLDLGRFLIAQPEPDDRRIGFQHIVDVAQRGHIPAMCQLGELYRDNHPAVMEQPGEQKSRWWRRWLRGSRQVNDNLKYSVAWYTRAAERRHVHAMMELVQIFLYRYDPPSLGMARQWSERAAHEGETEAMYSMAYIIGHQWSPPDLEGAIAWYTKAADAGHLVARYKLGIIARAETPEESRDHFEEALRNGYCDALPELIDLLLEEFDDPERAVAWSVAAANAGDVGAMLWAAHLLNDVVDPPRPKDARRWLTAAAKLDVPSAMWDLADLLDGLEPPRSREANRWRERAAQIEAEASDS